MQPHVDSTELISEGRFLVSEKVHYTDAGGVKRSWEAVSRRKLPGTVHGSADAVFIVAKIVPDDELVLVRQFRPPAGKLMVEFPAGLIDPGETAQTTAVRELYEETGFTGKVTKLFNGSYSSPGMTGESIILAVMEIDGAAYPDGFIPENHQEECENIEVFRVKNSELAEFITAMENAGCGIDSKLHTVLAFRQIGL